MKCLQRSMFFLPLLIPVFLVVSWHYHRNVMINQSPEHRPIMYQRTPRVLFPVDIDKMSMAWLKRLAVYCREQLAELQDILSSTFADKPAVNFEKCINLQLDLDQMTARLIQIKGKQKQKKGEKETQDETEIDNLEKKTQDETKIDNLEKKTQDETKIDNLEKEIKEMVMRCKQIEKTFAQRLASNIQSQQHERYKAKMTVQGGSFKLQRDKASVKDEQQSRLKTRSSDKQTKGLLTQTPPKKEKSSDQPKKEKSLDQAQEIKEMVMRCKQIEKKLVQRPTPNSQQEKTTPKRRSKNERYEAKMIVQGGSPQATQDTAKKAHSSSPPSSSQSEQSKKVLQIKSKLSFTKPQRVSLKNKISWLQAEIKLTQNRKMESILKSSLNVAKEVLQMACPQILLKTQKYKRLQQLHLKVKQQMIAAAQMNAPVKPTSVVSILKQLDGILKIFLSEFRELIGKTVQKSNKGQLSSTEAYNILWLAENKQKQQIAHQKLKNKALQQKSQKKHKEKTRQQQILRRREQRSQRVNQFQIRTGIIAEFKDECGRLTDELMEFMFDVGEIPFDEPVQQMKHYLQKIDFVIDQASDKMMKFNKNCKSKRETYQKNKRVLQLMQNQQDLVNRAFQHFLSDMELKISIAKEDLERQQREIREGVYPIPKQSSKQSLIDSLRHDQCKNIEMPLSQDSQSSILYRIPD